MYFSLPYSKPYTALLAFLGHETFGESVGSICTRIQEPSYGRVVIFKVHRIHQSCFLYGVVRSGGADRSLISMKKHPGQRQ